MYTINKIWWKCCVIARILSKHYWNQEKCQNLATTPYVLRGWIFYLSVNFHLTSFCRAENPTFRGEGGELLMTHLTPLLTFDFSKAPIGNTVSMWFKVNLNIGRFLIYIMKIKQSPGDSWNYMPPIFLPSSAKRIAIQSLVISKLNGRKYLV